MRAILLLGLGCLAACGGDVQPPPPPAPAHTESWLPELEQRVTELLAAVHAEPDDLEARLRLAACYEANGLPDLAREAWRQLTQSHPDELSAHYHLARGLVAAGELDEAARVLEDAPASADAEAAYLLPRLEGEAHLERAAFARARDAFERARGAAPDDLGSAVGLARAHLGLDDARSAADVLLEFLEDRPGLDYARSLCARALRLCGEAEQADAMERGALGLRPAWNDPWSAALERERVGPREALARANERIESGRASEALPELETLVGTWPEDTNVIAALVSAHVSLGQTEDALGVLDRADARMPSHHRLPLLRAQALQVAGRTAEAIEAVQDSIRRQPEFAQAHLELAQLHSQRRDSHAICAALAEAVRLGVRDARVLRDLGAGQRMLGQHEAAKQTFRLAWDTHPELVEFPAFLVRAAADTGELELAREALDAARALDPLHPQVRMSAQHLEQVEARQ